MRQVPDIQAKHRLDVAQRRHYLEAVIHHRNKPRIEVARSGPPHECSTDHVAVKVGGRQTSASLIQQDIDFGVRVLDNPRFVKVHIGRVQRVRLSDCARTEIVNELRHV